MLQRLGFDRQEARVLVWGAITLFLAGWADVSLKNVSEAYFVDVVGPERLPYVFLASSAALVATTWTLGHFVARRQRLVLLPRLLVVLALALLPLWFLITTHEGGTDRELKSAFGLLVIVSKQVQALALLAFWSAINDLVNARQAKRVFAPLMAGWTLGTILGSFASEPLAAWLGVPSLVPISSAALVLAGLSTYPLRRGLPTRIHSGLRERLLDLVRTPEAEVGPGSTAPSTPQEDAPASVRVLWRESALFRLLFATVLLSGMLGPMLYFQFQWVAHDATQSSPESLQRLLRLYALFRGWVNIGILIAQLTLTSSLYKRIGIPLSVLISPLTYLLGFAGLSVRFALPMGIGAMSLTKLQDNAVFEPASRVLYNLFPDRHRSRAGSFLDGPVKRGAGALGNIVIILALEGVSKEWVGYSGMGFALVWLVAAVALWREYPRLLLAAASTRREHSPAGTDWEEGMLDPATVRALSVHLLDPDPGRCALAIGLLEEARPALAIPAIAGALRQAGSRTRPLLLSALEKALDDSVTAPVRDAGAAAELEAILTEETELAPLERSRLVQCFGRLTPGLERSSLLDHALRHEVASVRLAAAAALGSDDLDERLRQAAASADPGERTIARRELRAALLSDPEDEAWEHRLALLAAMLEDPGERRASAEALADVAERHNERVTPVVEAVLRRRDDPDADTRIAILRFTGHARCQEHACWLVDHLGSGREAEAEAARDGLVAMGAGITDVLLKEASHGRRSKRDAILPLLRDLHVDHDELWELYERELAGIRKLIVQHHVLSGTPGLDLVEQRLDERIDEGLHTSLLLLASLRDRDEYESLAETLPGTPSGRRRATLVEVLEEIATTREKTDLLPLLEEDLDRRCARAAAALGILVPGEEEVLQQVAKSSDELTRVLVAGCLRTLGRSDWADLAVPTDLAPSADLEENAGVLSPTEIALQLKGLPMFDGLTTRQLMDLAQVVQELTHTADTTVVSEGGINESMFLIVEGQVAVRKQGRRVAELGPGEFFGEMSVLERARPSADVVTTEPTRLLCLQRADLFRLMEEFPTIPIIMCQTLSRRMRELLETRSETV